MKILKSLQAKKLRTIRGGGGGRCTPYLHDFGMSNGIDFQEFRIQYKARYLEVTFLKNWYDIGYTFSENW